MAVLITGASSGIGLEFAKIFAKNNYDLIIVARDLQKLNDIAEDLINKHKIRVEVITKDLSLSQAPEELYDEIKNKNLDVDILINNAGFATHGKFWEIDLKVEADEIMVNIMTLTILSKLFLKDMIKNNKGKILNVSSVAAFHPGPFMAVYYASKAYVLSLSKALSNEVKGTNVSITVLCPGPTESNFAKRGNVENTFLFKSKVMSSEEVVEKAYDGLISNKTIVIPGLKNKLSVYSSKMIPTKIALAVIRRLQEA